MVVERPEGERRAWQRSNLAIQQAGEGVTICNANVFNIDGVYKPQPGPDETPPVFRNKWGRCIYVDEEHRWRVAIARHAARKLGSTYGHLRSSFCIQPGMLPAQVSHWEVFSQETRSWELQPGITVSGVEQPSLIVTLVAEAVQPEDVVKLSLITMSGAEVACIQVNPNKTFVREVCESLEEQLEIPCKLKLLLPDGTMLAPFDGDKLVATLLELP